MEVTTKNAIRAFKLYVYYTLKKGEGLKSTYLLSLKTKYF